MNSVCFFLLSTKYLSNSLCLYSGLMQLTSRASIYRGESVAPSAVGIINVGNICCNIFAGITRAVLSLIPACWSDRFIRTCPTIVALLTRARTSLSSKSSSTSTPWKPTASSEDPIVFEQKSFPPQTTHLPLDVLWYSLIFIELRVDVTYCALEMFDRKIWNKKQNKKNMIWNRKCLEILLIHGGVSVPPP
jgi:hypothetical protein